MLKNIPQILENPRQFKYFGTFCCNSGTAYKTHVNAMGKSNKTSRGRAPVCSRMSLSLFFEKIKFNPIK